MRPIAVSQNPLRYPLNDLLGKPAHVRILRVLAESESPLAASELSARTEISAPGIHAALPRLVETGFVQVVGAGRARRHTLRAEDPIVRGLAELFATERRRYDDLLESVRGVFDGASPPPYSAWISSIPTNPAGTLEISVVASAESLTDTVRLLRTALLDVERRFDVTIELRPFSRGDLPRIDAGDYVYITGIPLGGAGGREAARTHEEKDRQALRRSQRLATLIRRDPSLIGRARRHVERALASGAGPSRHDLIEWRDILDAYSAHRLSKLLESETERAARLRQSSPFWAVLSESERDWLLAGAESDDT